MAASFFCEKNLFKRQKDETAALLSGCASSQKEVYRKMSLFFMPE